MDWLLLIVEIASIIAVFLLGLFTKNYLPSYMEKKGENLATKEDVNTMDQLESLKAQISGLTKFVSGHNNWKLVDIHIDIASAKKVIAIIR